jgi:hypothetical protein
MGMQVASEVGEFGVMAADGVNRGHGGSGGMN